MATDVLGGLIIGSAIKVHRRFGPGLLESTYKTCLAYELNKNNLMTRVEPYISVVYEDLVIERAFKPDLIVEDKIVLELKHVEKLLAIHEAQLRTYLHLTGVKTGLLFNFNTVVLKDGIRRIDLP